MKSFDWATPFGGDMPIPVYSLLEEYNFGAKVIIPFITHEGGGAAGTIDTSSQLRPGALVRDNALVVSRGGVAGKTYLSLQRAPGSQNIRLAEYLSGGVP